MGASAIGDALGWFGMSETINLGIVGAAGRGGSFKRACDGIPGLRVHAVCDANIEKLEEARQALGATEKYADFDEMLAKSDVQAVLIGTPMHFHAPQAIAALRRGVHVLSEVTAAVSIEECRQMVAAAKAPRAIYMMSENYCYTRQNLIIGELVRRGMFGEPYYAEGEYLHDLKELNEITKWRRKWQAGINGVTYGTHSLGPILQWMAGDRVVEVCCAGSGHHYRDPRGDEYETEETCVMLGRMGRGGLVKIRMDMLSNRPHAMTNYQLQGTDGAYESARAAGDTDRIWLKSRAKHNEEWSPLQSLGDEFLPAWYRENQELANKTGHGGGDFYVLLDFIATVTGKKPCPIGIHEALDMSLPGLVSQQSIQQKGAWLPVPDSRSW